MCKRNIGDFKNMGNTFLPRRLLGDIKDQFVCVEQGAFSLEE